MTQTILFIHGAWMTPRCWEPMVAAFTDKGFDCVAPAWPGKDRSVEAIRADPSPLAGLGVAQIVDHYAAIIQALPEPPILVGHSFGGLFVQLLLDRGLGRAGVAIDPAPPKGVNGLAPSAVRSLIGVLATPFGWRKPIHWSFERFRYAFVHTLPADEQRAAYDRHVVPETGRIFFQAAAAPFSPGSPLKLDFKRAVRAPLLIIAGEADRIVPATVVRRTFKRYAAGTARTDFKAFPGRVHWIIAEPGYREVVEHIRGWLQSVAPVPG